MLRKGLLIAVALACGLLAALFVQQQLNRLPGNPEDPALSLPPAILTPQELGSRQSLFDHQSLSGWSATGPAQVKDGTLVLGGKNGATLFLLQEIDIGQTLEFHFFQEGSGKAVMHMFPDPRDPDANPALNQTHSLNISGHVYQRWHAARLHVTHEADHLSFALEYKPLHDGMGMSSSANFTCPSRKGRRGRIGFEVEPGSILYLRNVTLAKAKQQP